MVDFVATTAMRIRHLLPLAAVAAPVLAAAQTPTTGREAFALRDGEPISYLLEHSRLLDLSEEQRSYLIDVRRRLRARTAPFMRQLDSLRELVGLSLAPRRRTADDAAAMERFQRLAQPIVDSVRAHHDLARREALVLLDSLQRARLDSLVTVQGSRSSWVRVLPGQRTRTDTGTVNRARRGAGSDDVTARATQRHRQWMRPGGDAVTPATATCGA